MIGVDLEQAIHDAIERFVTEENIEETKRYFNQVIVNDMIDEVFEIE